MTDPRLVSLEGPDLDVSATDDNDWNFSVDSPRSVTQGGLNGISEGWSFTDDFNGILRPAATSPWAIGAYEP